jgi:outer membrane receptor protein involved in Fe transport
MRHHLSLGAFALSAISVAHAQQQSSTGQSVSSQAVAVAVPRIEVLGSANSYDPRRDDTAARIVVSNDELVKYGDSSVAEALKRVPGVMVTSTGRGSDIRMRGLGGGYTQILVNGERAPFGFSIDSLPPEQVERIEVIRSAIAEFSTESIAGTINIVLKKVAKRADRQIQIGYGGDATDRTSRAVLMLSDRLSGFSYSISAYARSSALDRDRLIEEAGADASGRPNLLRTTNSHDTGPFNIVSIVPRLNWTLSNGDTLSSESVFTYTKFGFNAEQLATSTLGDPPLYPALDWRIRSRNSFLKSDLVWDTRLSPESRLEVKMALQGASGDNNSSRDGHAGLASLLQNRMEVSAHDRGLDSSGKFSQKMGQTHQLKAGWEASRTKRDEENDEFNLVGEGAAPTLTVTPLNARIVRLASFLQDEWTVMPNWMAYVGVRWERIATEISADRLIKTASSIFSPIAQTLIKLPNMPNDQLRIAFTRTFKAPEIASLSPQRRKFETNSSTNPDRAGNPGLRPEQARGLDVTYEHYFTKSALFSIGGSNREIDDYTLTEVTVGTDGRWVGRPINAGRARTRGLELEAKFPLTLLEAKLPAVEVRANLSRNWSSVEQVPSPGNRVAQQMPLSASLSLDYSYGALSTGGSFNFRQGAWSRVSAAQRAGTWNNRNLDLYGVWKLNAKQQMRVTLGNLLAEDAITASEYTDAAGTIRRTSIAPGSASVRALFEQRF